MRREATTIFGASIDDYFASEKIHFYSGKQNRFL
jgi:hypothetical protein